MMVIRVITATPTIPGRVVYPFLSWPLEPTQQNNDSNKLVKEIRGLWEGHILSTCLEEATVYRIPAALYLVKKLIADVKYGPKEG
ncbi:hypothetical protein MRB53_028398 [Persea americana]|uniref:Uncharacterized protein n=1 Tax=Persea americana TaxID=3435 RepID=A0ACC2KFE6_PERAE|nr:hypothetical protein MRB53_028398 [Persea americana]